LRRLENADFTTDVTVENGEGHISVEAVDDKGEYRNFLNLNTVVVSPKGERVTVRLEQSGPGHYEARFPTKEVGSYLLNLMETKDGKPVGTQVVGASVNYSPEFTAPEPNLNLLARLAEAGGGKLLDAALPEDPANNPFLHDRRMTFQPRDWWEWLLKLAIVLFVLDVAVRRIQIDRDQWEKAMARVKQTVFFWKGVPRPAESDVSLAALLARRDQVRTSQPVAAPEARPELFQPQQPVVLPSRPVPADSASPKLDIQEPEPPSASGAQKPESTTSRLLDAKRRAQRKRD
jgi:hypothetical protein